MAVDLGMPRLGLSLGSIRASGMQKVTLSIYEYEVSVASMLGYHQGVLASRRPECRRCRVERSCLNGRWPRSRTLPDKTFGSASSGRDCVDSASWQKMFGSFRPEDQINLVVTVGGGPEVAVQQIARIEEEIVMIRGRVAGQAENGRLFLIPYDKITGVYVNRSVQFEEVELFSPTVSPQRKEEVARIVAALAEKAREEANSAEKSLRTKEGGPVDLKRQLEELREKAGLGGGKLGGPAALPAPVTPQGSSIAPSKMASVPPPTPLTPPLRPSSAPHSPSENPTVGIPVRGSLPTRPTLPKPPEPTGKG